MVDTDAAPHRPGVLPSDLGEIRTIMAADRTLMAWIRTSLSMLSFGFTIYKFLQTIASNGKMEHPDSPQQVGLFLTGLGVAAIVLGTASYWVTLRDLQKVEKFRIGRPVLLMALIMSIAGVASFVSIATRLI
jgi:putative membrane protein